MASKGAELKALMKKGIVVLPGVFNALMAKLVEQEGFDAAYVSGAGISNTLTGLPDIGLLTLSEMAQQVRYLANATKLPLLCDADTGYGEVFNTQRCVRELEQAGAAGLHLEDQENPKRCGHLDGKRVVEPRVMVEKIRAAVRARRDRDFLIVARTDARAVNGFEDAVRRAKLYRAAGADAIFPEAMESVWEFGAFAQELKCPLMANMTEFGKSPLLSSAKLESLGYKMVIFPMTLVRVSMKAGQQVLREIKKKGSQKVFLSKMQTRAELYQLLDYDAFKAADKDLDRESEEKSS